MYNCQDSNFRLEIINFDVNIKKQNQIHIKLLIENKFSNYKYFIN